MKPLLLIVSMISSSLAGILFIFHVAGICPFNAHDRDTATLVTASTQAQKATTDISTLNSTLESFRKETHESFKKANDERSEMEHRLDAKIESSRKELEAKIDASKKEILAAIDKSSRK